MQNNLYPSTKQRTKTKMFQNREQKIPIKRIEGLADINFDGNVTSKLLLC